MPSKILEEDNVEFDNALKKYVAHFDSGTPESLSINHHKRKRLEEPANDAEPPRKDASYLKEKCTFFPLLLSSSSEDNKEVEQSNLSLVAKSV